jgi:mRNA interferase RelE/StbE
MQYEFEKAFAHDLRRLKDKELAKTILEVTKLVSEAKFLNDIPNIKKLTGFKSAYRIRSGDYRIGIIFEKGVVIFVAFSHRKDITTISMTKINQLC